MQNGYSSLAEVLSDIVKRYPNNIAIKDDKRSLTYQELYCQALRGRNALLRYGIRAEDRIVCISKKNTDSLVCFWSIILCGAVPVMLDHEDGLTLNKGKIGEVDVKAVIMDKSSLEVEIEFGLMGILDFKDLEEQWDFDENKEYICPYSPEKVCYILLTSGTTGRSKAVQISHRNVLHYAYSIYEKLGSPEKANAVHASTFAADLGLTNLLVALVSGGMLRILNKIESTDPATFTDILVQDEISLLKITPSHLLALISGGAKYKKPIDNIVLGGEKLSWETVKTIFSLGICSRLYNHYGPTETTIGAIAFRIDTDSRHFDTTGSVPLGAPLGENCCFFESSGKEIGELCITGPGVSIGYFENEPENKKKFFTRIIDGREILCYRTGDICRKLDDGNYEFLYRTDRQVKVKGYRIELGEIELAISCHPDIENAIVCLSDDNKHAVIDAYIKIPKGRQPIADIRAWMSDKLPAYKIPSNFYFYTEAPYNSNGKIDLNALKKLVKSNKTIPAAETDGMIGNSWPAIAEALWKRILNIDEIAGSDNFFEIGGDSLMAIQLIGRLQRYGFKIHIADLNNHSIFSDFASLDPVTIMEQYKSGEITDHLTFSQRSFLQHNDFNLHRYCQTILLEAEDKIKIREMAMSFNHILQTHSELTRGFRQNPESHAGRTNGFPGKNFGVSVLDPRKSVVVQIQDCCNEILNGISLDKGPLFMAHIFIDHNGKDYIYLICHHVAIDIISWNIIIDELWEYYERVLKNNSLVITPENTVNRFFEELTYKTAGMEVPMPLAGRKIFKLPKRDSKKSAVRPIGVYQVVLPDELSAILQNLQEQGQPSTLSGFLLSALANAVLQEFSIPEISIDMEFHGRPQQEELPDLSRSVAWWAATLPVNIERGHASPDNCADLITEAAVLANKINLLYGQFPRISPVRPDIRFNYLGHFPAVQGNDAIRLKPASFNPGPTRDEKANEEYKLYFTARFIDRSLIIDWQYQLKIVSQANIDNIVRIFFDSLKRSVRHMNSDCEKLRLSVIESNMPSVGQPMFNLKDNFRRPLEKKTIFLTGATGFLGTHLVDCLSKDQAADIYCLVRGKDQQHAEYRMASHIHHFFNEFPDEKRNRIHVVKGDLSADKFGMTEADYNKIVNEADLILHAAADINLMKDYKELLQTNILPVQKIIDLAGIGKKKEIHYVSTLAVSGYSPNGRYVDFSEDDFSYGQAFISDYERSKFEAEKMIRLFLENGGMGGIYRVGHIAADSLYGRFQRNIDQNRIFQIIKGIILVKKSPHIYNENLSFSYVDIVAKGISHCCLGIIDSQSECLHIDNPDYLSFNKIVEMLRQIGYHIDSVDMNDFKDTIDNYEGVDSDKRSVDLMHNWIQRSVDFPRKVGYINGKSLDLMGKAGLYFPKTDFEWFSCMIHEGIKAGYFQSPLSVNKRVSIIPT